MIFTYTTIYYLIPKYFDKRKYYKFAISLSLLTILNYTFFMLFILWVAGVIHQSPDAQLFGVWRSSWFFVSAGPVAACVLFLTIKILKGYYQKLEEKKLLIRENADAELQLLKAQIHPHFLFNTLNNIYSFTLSKSPHAADLVLKLKDTLKYMVNDCDAALVPLENELKMIQDYIELEKVRYGKRLKAEVLIQGDYQNKLIAPLLLIPFVENCFKHGTSKMLQQPWMKLQINITENILCFELCNSKPVENNCATGRNGIGLKNVQKRLALLHPGKYELTISSTGDTYSINMKIPLAVNEQLNIQQGNKKNYTPLNNFA